MNLRQIRYFCEVVTAGTAARAAERLFVAPTAISMQLTQLEQHLGGELFDRSRRPMELTALGKFFYPRAKELLTHAERLDDEVRGVATGSWGWLAIGFTRSAIFSLLPTAIRNFREQSPDVHVDLVETLSEYQAEQLRQHRIDLGISRFIGPFERAPDMHYEVILEEPFVAALPVGHRLAKQASVSIEEFTSLPFILYPKDSRSPFGRQMFSLLQDVGGSPVVAYEAVEIHTALALVGAGLGGTIVGRSIAENSRSDVACLPIGDQAIGTLVVAVTRKDEDSRMLESFLTMLRDVARPL
ncbi:LysR family transcriptional regulator [Stutzerimonas stutzeri]|uniref:LysR family transcriptional regulator n=1 Tax=Stutzerimonas stutzeri TaxID=316 RepID=W8QYS7_STUST|nr:LysR family transcriptional regulator [Stutzerimonas stutzeri]AHL75449.1 LysR family transcriptional regulator [Stutzerimonas stutzeri]MCQ4327986.1 LysR family transcriptional regulator [Stutzerimonas stutzeri]